MRKLILPLLLMTPLLAPAQTKKIAHGSHSGSPASFSTTSGNDDFGAVPWRNKEPQRADTVRNQQQAPARRTKIKRKKMR